MDVLSDTLRVVRLAGAIFFTADFAAPWCVRSPAGKDYAHLLDSHADCITIFHVVVNGRCRVALDGQPAFFAEAGDVVIFPHADPHTMGSYAEVFPAADVTLQILDHIQTASEWRVSQTTFGTAGEVVHLLCGYLQCDQRFNPLLGSLPKLLLVRTDRRAELTPLADALPPWCLVRAESGDWLDTTLRFIIDEAGGERPGSSAMLPRLTELLYVEVLRRYMQQLPVEYAGWLAAVRDPIVGRALRLMHTTPERAWSVEELAQAALVSRSALAQRFTALIGEPPMQYLQGWRMQLAQHLLGQTNLSIAQIAARAGYGSEAAFNRTFKRAVGQPPARWRRAAGSGR